MIEIGIDVHLNFDGMPEIDWKNASKEEVHDYFAVMDAPGYYIRESYFHRAYATYVFIPECFREIPFTQLFAGQDGEPMPNADPHQEVVIEYDENGYPDKVRYPWKVLAGRLEAVAQKAQERYPDNPDWAKEHIEDFMLFVQKMRELQEAGVDCWVTCSY